VLVIHQFMKGLRLPMGFSEVVILRRTDNTIVKRKGTKRQNNGLRNQYTGNYLQIGQHEPH
jgi:hypothetical protein